MRRDKRQRLLGADEGRTPYPVAVPRTHSLAQVRAAHPDLEAGAETDDVVSVAGRVVFVRTTGEALLRHAAGGRRHPAAGDALAGQRGRAGARRLQGRRRPGRLPVRHRPGGVEPSRRAVGDGRRVGDGGQGAAPAARPAQGRERGDPGPPALRRPGGARGGAPDGAAADRRGGERAPHLRRPRLPRDRDADAADDARRRHGASVRHALERDGHRPVPAHRSGAVPQARGRGRHRAGLRGQPQLPQRGRRLEPLAGVRDDRGLPGVRRLRLDRRRSPARSCSARRSRPPAQPP